MGIKKKNLTLAAVKKDDKRFEERYQVTVNGYTLEIDRTFRPTKISAMLGEVIEKYDETKAHKQNILEIFTPYVILQMIKHFTSLEIPNGLDEQLKILDMLIDGDYLLKIYENMPKDQIDLVYTEIEKIVNRMNDNMADLSEKYKGIQITNKDILGLDIEDE